MTNSIVVTGASGGIGVATVIQLLDLGYSVVGIDIDAEGLARLSPRVEDRNVEFIVGDASDHMVALRAAGKAREMGELVGWVNNAAVFRQQRLDEVEPREFATAIMESLASSIVGSSVALKTFLMYATPGAIVNVSSIQGRRAFPGWGPYAIAKAALEALTRAIAVDYGELGIRANAVAPGTVSTPRYREWLESVSRDEAEAYERALAHKHPIGRIGEPGEIAALIAFLISPDAGFITGASIPIDGGRSIADGDPPIGLQ